MMSHRWNNLAESLENGNGRMTHKSFLLTGAILVLAGLAGVYALSANVYMFQVFPASLPSWGIAVYVACFLAFIMGVSLFVHVLLSKIEQD